jgi:hypothetical protein
LRSYQTFMRHPHGGSLRLEARETRRGEIARRRWAEREGNRGEVRSGHSPHRPLRPPNIMVDAGWMQAPASVLQVSGAMQVLFWSEKWPKLANRPRWRAAGRYTVSARVALSFVTRSVLRKCVVGSSVIKFSSS